MQTLYRVGAVLAVVLLATSAVAQEPSTLTTEDDKLSYALGARIGRDLRNRSELEIKPELLFKGINDALGDGPMLMNEQEVDATMNSLRQKMVLAAQERAEENRRKGAEFLAANKNQEGVVTLKSGLQYKILKQGDGPKPTVNNRVVVNYRGTFIDGTEFDSSSKRNQPTSIGLKQVIKGWREALLLMPVGSKWQLFIPPRLAYGTRGHGRQIGPNTVLIFEIELIEIMSKDIDSNAQIGASSVNDEGAQKQAQSGQLAEMVVSYKLDPSLMGGSYAQPGWVTPQVYQGVRGQDTVEVKVAGLDAQGRPIESIKTEWIPEDPEMVTVSAGTSNSVKILIHKPGESNVTIVSGDLSTTLSIKAESKDNVLQVQISQL